MLTRKDVMDLQDALRGKEITIIGHDNIDVDSALSGILLSKFLRYLRIDNEFCILEEVKEDDTYRTLKELFGIDLKEYQKIGENAERNFVLVDHYETMHEGNVVACIDHHPSSKSLNYAFKYVRNSCATMYLIYELMMAWSYTFMREDIRMIVAAMLIDTVSFRSTKTVEDEALIARELSKRYRLDFELLEKYGLGITEITKMKDEQIISNGEKWYSYRRKNDVSSSYIQLYGMPTCEKIHYWLTLLSKKLYKTGADMLVFIIYDMKANKTHEYKILSGRTEMICHLGILSRGKDIMPKIEERFLNAS